MPEFIRMVKEFVAAGIASIIDQNIDTTEPFDQGGSYLLYLSGVRYIAWNRLAPSTRCPDFSDKLLELDMSASFHSYVCPCPGERQSDAASNSTSSAGDDRSSSCERMIVTACHKDNPLCLID